MTYLLENCADSVASCLTAEASGASRIELCSALPVGGLTPSAGMVAQALEQVSLPIFPIIRPRSGDFLYSPEEVAVMLDDVRMLVALGVHGVVVGALCHDGTLDTETCRRLIDAAQGRPVTLHRAFDRAADLHATLEVAIELGFARVLTSGGYPTAAEGQAVIRKLVEQAAGRIVVMAGSGVTPQNIRTLVQETGVREVHGTFGMEVKSGMTFRPGSFAAHYAVEVDEYGYRATDPTKVTEAIGGSE